MKNTMIKTALILCAAFQISNVSAQLVLPQPSPKASVMQTVGLTDITIDYSSPGVKGRAIWGDVVPYDKVWRAGANAATKITFSKDVVIEGTAVPKGSYSIFMIPSKAEWTIIINKNPTASMDEYKQDMDLLRMKSMPAIINNCERLAYTITDFNDDAATVSLAWEKVRVSFKVALATDKQAVENIDKTTGNTWSIYNSAARYYFDKKDYEKALNYANQSLSLSQQWFNNWMKAQILFAKGLTNDAYKFAQIAKEIGDQKPDGFFYKTQVEKALVDWKSSDTKKKK
jgi:Protein of unknown function (DUF2911)